MLKIKICIKMPTNKMNQTIKRALINLKLLLYLRKKAIPRVKSQLNQQRFSLSQFKLHIYRKIINQ